VGGGAVVRVRRLAALGAILVLFAGAAAALEPSPPALEELRQRRTRGVTGTIAGRIYVERLKPDAPDTALAGVGVLVVPRSDELLERLETARRQARESMTGFREAAPVARAAIDEYERRLWQAGYPDLAVRTATDAAGAFEVAVPTGAWLLVATHSVYVPTAPPSESAAPTAQAVDPFARYRSPSYQHFLPTARLVGYDAVTVWLRELVVEAGATLALELHDRGLWLSGVDEDHEVPRRVRFAPRGPRR
jgi:hypothetical protein